MAIEEHVAVRCPSGDTVDVDTGHARIFIRAGAQLNQHQPLLHAISRTLERLGVLHQLERGEPFTADRNLWMNIVVRSGGLRNAPKREYREKSILLDVTHADPQAQVRLRGRSADHDDQLPLPPRRASANITPVRDTYFSTTGVTTLPP